jgi:tripartite ATP-independent transporter DctM subunit
MKTVLGAVFSVWGCFIFIIMGWQSVVRAVESYQQNSLADVTSIPYYPFNFIAGLGCFLIAMVLLSNLFKYFSNILKLSAKQAAWVIPAVMIVAGLTIAFPFVLRFFSIELGNITIGLIIIVLLLVIMFLGFPVAFAMAFTGFLGLCYLIGADVSFNIIRLNTYDAVAHYFFCVVPFFILMGFLCLKSGIGAKLFRVASKWFGRLPGGLAIGTVFGCGGFAAICGDSMATAATMGSVSLPEMKKYNYDPSLAAGSVAAGGTLGILIPPSIGFIVYAIVTEESIGKLFVAGMIPGIILTTLFGVVIYLQCRWNTSLGPPAAKVPFLEKIISLKDVWQVALLFVLVIGGIYSGIVTPTEAGGVGVIGALIVAIFSKEFSWKGFLEAILISTQMTAMVFTILIGVSVLGYFVTLTNIPVQFAGFIGGLAVSRYVIFVLILLLYLFLGMLMNIIPMMLLTLPILFPTVLALGFDPIWFGVIMVIMMEMGQITPPIGINVFVIHGIADNVGMGQVFKGILPFIVVEVLVIAFLTIFPEIVMWLPDAMDVLPAIE